MINLDNYDLIRIKSITKGKKEHVFDIEVDSDEHAFIAESPTGAIGISHNSALISFSNLSDERMRHAKSGQWWIDNKQREMANNSVAYSEKPEIGSFINEWKALYDSKSGERGIYNLQAAKKKAMENGRRDLENKTDVYHSNPCSEIILQDKQFCVRQNTFLITKDGIDNIYKFKNKKVEVWNGNKWSEVIVRLIEEKTELVRVEFSDGSFLECTPDHKFSVKHRFLKNWKSVEAKNLMNGIQIEETTIINESKKVLSDSYTLGFAVGDGFVYNDKVSIDLYGEKDIKCPVIGGISLKEYLSKNYNVSKVRIRTKLDSNLVLKLKNDIYGFKELFSYNKNSILNFVAGLADANGAQSSNGIRIYISKYERAFLLQLLLTKNGIKSSLNLFQSKGTKTNLSIRKHDLYYLQITNCKDIPCHRLNVFNGRNPIRNGKYQIVKQVIKLNEKDDVYCFEEKENHKAVFNNVLTHQCNLSEVVIRENDTFEILKEKVEIATIIGTIQSMWIDFKYISKEWKKNCEEERLLGVSLTGIMDNTLTSNNSDLSGLLESLKEHSIKVNEKYAKKLGIPQSAAITTVKPSGCQTFDGIIKSENGNISLAEIFNMNDISPKELELDDNKWFDVKVPLKVYDENNKLQNVTRLYCNGIKPVYEIEFEDGSVYKFTGNHKLKTRIGWKRVDELSEKDDIINF